MVIVDPVHEYAVAALAEDFEIVTRLYPSEAELELLLRNAHTVVLRSGVTLNQRLIESAPELRIIARAGVGIDNIDVRAARARGVAVCNVPDGSAAAVAELALGLMFAVARKIPLADRSMRAQRWDKPQLGGIELRARNLGVVGVGRIGSEIGVLGRAIGMTVMGVVARPSDMRSEALAALGIRLTGLDELLRTADVICLAMPLTDQTRHFVGRDEIARMKRSALLINVARGAVVNARELYRALHDGELAGAALDVHGDEAHTRRFGTLDNVVLTPHIGAMTSEAQERIARVLVRSIRAALANAPDPNRIC
jgi:D-3-phosphoglycerate dehydrogenase